MIDKYYERSYDARSYNCWHLCSEFWMELTGAQLPELASDLGKTRRNFERLATRVDPCIALRSSPGQLHAGIYYNRRVLHLTEFGAKYEHLEVFALGALVSFYLPCQH